MKTINKTLFAAAALTLQSATYAGPPADRPEGERPPQGERPPRGERGDRPGREDVLARFDKDTDGKLSPKERVPMIKERMKLQPKFAAMLKEKFDADKDGKLSDPELLEAAKNMPKRGKRGGRGAKADRSGEGRE